MTSFSFVSNEEFPDDPYTKEIVYLLFENKYRIAYVRKQAKNGGMFWDVATIGVNKDGIKTYFESFLQDSAFLEKDIKRFLDSRSWEDKKTLLVEEELPF